VPGAGTRVAARAGSTLRLQEGVAPAGRTMATPVRLAPAGRGRGSTTFRGSEHGYDSDMTLISLEPTRISSDLEMTQMKRHIRFK
jgi:hypothetical protein